MKIYNYDSETKVYLSSQNADLDPEETKIQGKDIYLIPDNATTTRPPAAKENNVRVWYESKWIYVVDYRQNYYKVDSDLTVYEIEKIGEIEQGYILVEKETGDLIKENPDNYIIDNDSVREKTAEEKQADKDAKLATLSLTKREVFLALYRDKGVTPEQIREQILNPEALIEFDYASEYFRGNPLIDEIGETLGYTKEQLDYLFEYKELPEDE